MKIGQHNMLFTVILQLREANTAYSQENNAQMSVSMRLWQAAGCHEFLASLGFDLFHVAKDDVTVKAGKQANRRTLQFGLQALVAIFGKNILVPLCTCMVFGLSVCLLVDYYNALRQAKHFL